MSMSIKNDSEIFCENIKKLRKKAKLSKREMAKRLRIGVKSLTLIESGKIPPRLSAEVIITIYRNFGVMPSELFTYGAFEQYE